MDEVSVGTIRILANGISGFKNISAEQIIAESPLAHLQQRKDTDWLTWNQMVEWMNWVDASHLAPVDWRRVGEIGFHKQNAPPAARFCRMTFSVSFAYWLAAKWYGPSQMRVVSCQFEDLENNQIRETLFIPETLNPCPQIFHVFSGALTVLPQSLFDLKPAAVSAVIDGRKGVYHIILPKKISFWKRTSLIMQSLFRTKYLFGELVTQQEAIHAQAMKLMKERSEMKNMISHFPDGVLIHRDGTLLYINEIMGNFLNYPDVNVLVGKNVLDLIMPEHREKIRTRIAASVEDPRVVHSPTEVSFCKSDSGESFDGECTSMSFYYDGHPAIMVVTRDLSDRKRYQSHMLATDRLVSLGRLAAGVGHEINNPLFYVMLKLDSIRENLKERVDEATMKKFEEISYGLNRIQSIVKDLKTLSQGSNDDNVIAVDVGANLRSAILMSTNEIQYRAQLTTEIEELPKILANEAHLGQIFLNLLVNSAQAIEPGNVSKNKIHVKAFVKDQRVVVQISDSGPGIPEHVKKNIFQAFYTTKPVGQGTGLGLSICQSLVNRYKGQISFDSAVGQGTRFTVSFPISNGDKLAETSPESYPVRLPMNFSRGRVLIIDDDKMLLETLSFVLASENETKSFSDAEQALAYIRSGEKFNAILCDLMMPNMSGMEFYKLLGESNPELCEKVIFLTGGSFTDATENFLRQPGIRSYQKPVTTQNLRKIIRDVMGEHQTSRIQPANSEN